MSTNELIEQLLTRLDALSMRYTPDHPLPSSLNAGGIGIAELLSWLDPPTPLMLLLAMKDDGVFMTAYEILITKVGTLLIEERRRHGRATRQ